MILITTKLLHVYYICLLDKLTENTIIYIAFITFKIYIGLQAKSFCKYRKLHWFLEVIKNINHTTSKRLFVQKDINWSTKSISIK